jgi:hypothetical protein
MLSLQRDIRKFSKYGQPGTSFQSHDPDNNESDAGGHEKIISDVSAGDNPEKKKVNNCTIL